VILDRGLSTSLVGIDCKASMVADCGGVFSPRILCGGRRKDGRRVGVSLDAGVAVGVVVAERLESFSGDLNSTARSLLPYGDAGRLNVLSGDLDGDEASELPSMKLLRSLTLPVCKDCIRLCAAPFMRERSGDSMRFGGGGLFRKASRAFSVKAACADWMVVEVLGREVILGDEEVGFRGSGGGALSGSELSHLWLYVNIAVSA
jgi:hypothetical protein